MFDLIMKIVDQEFESRQRSARDKYKHMEKVRC